MANAVDAIASVPKTASATRLFSRCSPSSDDESGIPIRRRFTAEYTSRASHELTSKRGLALGDGHGQTGEWVVYCWHLVEEVRMDKDSIKTAEANIAELQSALDDAQQMLQAAERAQEAAERAHEAAQQNAQVLRTVAIAAIAGAVVIAVVVGRRRHRD